MLVQFFSDTKSLTLGIINKEIPKVLAYLHRELTSKELNDRHRAIAGSSLAEYFYKNKNQIHQLGIKLPQDFCASKISKTWTGQKVEKYQFKFEAKQFLDLLKSVDLSIKTQAAYLVRPSYLFLLINCIILHNII